MDGWINEMRWGPRNQAGATKEGGSRLIELIVQLFTYMSRPVGFSLWRLAEAARAPFFPYATQTHVATLVQGRMIHRNRAKATSNRTCHDKLTAGLRMLIM
jgi:hypothetical protein